MVGRLAIDSSLLMMVGRLAIAGCAVSVLDGTGGGGEADVENFSVELLEGREPAFLNGDGTSITAVLLLLFTVTELVLLFEEVFG